MPACEAESRRLDRHDSKIDRLTFELQSVSGDLRTVRNRVSTVESQTDRTGDVLSAIDRLGEKLLATPPVAVSAAPVVSTMNQRTATVATVAAGGGAGAIKVVEWLMALGGG